MRKAQRMGPAAVGARRREAEPPHVAGRDDRERGRRVRHRRPDAADRDPMVRAAGASRRRACDRRNFFTALPRASRSGDCSRPFASEHCRKEHRRERPTLKARFHNQLRPTVDLRPLQRRLDRLSQAFNELNPRPAALPLAGVLMRAHTVPVISDRQAQVCRSGFQEETDRSAVFAKSVFEKDHGQRLISVADAAMVMSVSATPVNRPGFAGGSNS